MSDETIRMRVNGDGGSKTMDKILNFVPLIVVSFGVVFGYAQLTSDVRYLRERLGEEREARLINEQRFEKYTTAAEERLEEKLRPIRKTLNVVQQNIGAVCQATPGARCASPGAVDRGD